MSTISIRVSRDLFARAQHQAELTSRSIAQQVEHWARLWAALESTEQMNWFAGGRARKAKLVNSPF